MRTARPSGEDIFDLDKCMACVRHAIALKVVPATASVFGGRATKRRRGTVARPYGIFHNSRPRQRSSARSSSPFPSPSSALSSAAFGKHHERF